MKRIKIFGPPGTGKTTFLVNTAQNYLKSGHRSDEIAFVTFTRTAQAEAVGRLEEFSTAWPYVRTLHSLCYRAIGMSQSRIAKPADFVRFGNLVGCEISGEPVEGEETILEEMPLGDRLLRLNHVGRHRKLNLNEALEKMPVDVDLKLAKHFTLSYREWKRNENFVDFTDILSIYLSHGKPLGCGLFIVDEAQDLSPLQWDVVEKMGSRAEYFLAAGDDDQAIYTWAGATAAEFNEWRCDETIILDQSYRLPQAVWVKCNQIACHIKERTPKTFYPRHDGVANVAGSVTHEMDLPDLDPKRSSLVLYRFAHRGKQLAQVLKAQGVPFGGALSLMGRPYVRKALEALGLPKTKRKKEHIEALRVAGAFGDSERPSEFVKIWDSDYLQECFDRFGLEVLLNPPITLSSVHQAKGREADDVYLDLTMSRATYETLQEDPDSEHRVFYVGASRARERLIILEGNGEYLYDL